MRRLAPLHDAGIALAFLLVVVAEDVALPSRVGEPSAPPGLQPPTPGLDAKRDKDVFPNNPVPSPASPGVQVFPRMVPMLSPGSSLPSPGPASPAALSADLKSSSMDLRAPSEKPRLSRETPETGPSIKAALLAPAPSPNAQQGTALTEGTVLAPAPSARSAPQAPPGMIPNRVVMPTPPPTPRPRREYLPSEADAGRLHHVPEPQLSPMQSVRCLKIKQRLGAHSPCTPSGKLLVGPAPPGPLSVGNYPAWQDARCRSNGQLFCDPEGLLKDSERVAVTTGLSALRASATVTCGSLKSQMTHSDESYSKPFNFGVAIADEWPRSETDSSTLQSFGQFLLARWGLLPTWNGADNTYSVDDSSLYPTARDYWEFCPNSAVLIILPRYKQAFFAAPSCEFLCKDRGGPEVVAATLRALNSDGLAAAVQAATKAVCDLLPHAVAVPLSMQDPAPRQLGKRPSRAEREARAQMAERSLVFFQRLALVALGLFTIVSVVAFVVYQQAPEEPRLVRKSDKPFSIWS